MPDSADRRRLTADVVAGWSVAAAGMAVLAIGWWGDVEAARGGTGEAVTRPTTALVLVLCGVALTQAKSRGRSAAGLTGLGAALVSVQLLVQRGGVLGLDGWLGATPQDAGSVGVLTALPVIALALTSVALLAPGRPSRGLAEFLGLTVATTSSVLALSWLLATVEGLTVPTATSPLTSSALLVLAMGWLRRSAEDGVVLRSLVQDTAPARSMRRVLAWLLGTVAALMVLVRVGPRGGLLADPSVRSAVSATVVFGAVLLVAAWTTRDLERAGREVRRSEGRLRALVEAMTQVVWSTDDRGRFALQQQSWEAYTGQPWAVHQDLGWLGAVHPNDRDRVTHAWTTAMSVGDRFRAEARLWHAPSRTHRAVVMRAVPTREQGRVTAWVGTVADVEDLRRANRQLRTSNIRLERRVAARTTQLQERNRQLERSNEELDRFASVASHDLQEPLRMVSAYTELLTRKHAKDLDQDARELMAFVLDGAQRMQVLIDDLLEYSRLRTRDTDHVRVDLDAVLADVGDGLRLVVEETGAHLSVGDLPHVWGDPTQLRMLFHNLVGNALKYRAEEPPVVEVDAQAAAGEWRVRISDNGIGIAEAHRERIFQPFRRLHARSRYPGTGIGLAICRRIVEQHGGRIWVEANTSQGSVFCLMLPDGDHGPGGHDGGS